MVSKKFVAIAAVASAAALATIALRPKSATRTETDTVDDSVAIDEAAVGTILKQEELPAERIISAPNGAKTLRVTYGARNAHGTPIAVTGLVTFPVGEAPQGGWPVLSWAHGTTGITRQAAPSLAIDTHPDHEAFELVVEDYLQVWLDKGFAVIQPDYEGLGTTGNGTYMDRHSLASSVNEMVRATREKFGFAETWYNTGWSQGGFAAVSAASAENVATGLVKTLAIAPGDTFVPATEIPAEVAKEMAAGIDEENLAYSAFALQGAMNFNPAIRADDFLSEEGKKVMDFASKVCLTTFKEENTTPGKDIFNDAPTLTPLLEHLAANSMAKMYPKTPVVIFSSEDDEIINFEQISAGAKALQGNDGTDVTFEVRTGEGHRDMVRRAIEDQTPFVPELQDGPGK
ncbi:alpha/beta hydrolase [Corynebacterium liangguodongii]|uniref:Uncharacterized protein n=1 Tax=Corynebacterium liangguodongii TaxID=2079535 RepID=A0A2S0WDB3_9CORY|nr:lipase family protein [Corynebacterium liangguodongii]AWB83758.1 hypothetical protein C3E79_04040 [Corynebacterium liangguodongii]PWB99432.1 hypothetical protein DF219_05755 [Corynebacterium liangguodongii]